MPIVPKYNSSSQQRAISSPTANADSFGAVQARQTQELGNQVSRAGSQLADYALKEQERENVTAFQNSVSQYEARMSEFKTEADKRNGYQAKGLSEEAQAFSEKLIDEQLKNMPNEVVKQQFRQRAMSRQTAFMASFAGFENRQLEKAQVDAHKAATKSAIDNAAAFHDDAEILRQNQNTIDNNIEIMAMQQGWDDATKKQAKQDSMNLFHKQVISARLQSGDTSGASAYLEQFEGQMTGSSLVDARKSVKSYGLKAEAQNQTDLIMSQGLGQSAALEEARKISNPDIRDSVVSRIKTRYAEAKVAETRQYNKSLDDSYKHILKGGSLDDFNPEVLDGLKGKDLAALKRLEQTGDKTPRTDWNLWTQIQQEMVSSPNKVKDNYASYLLRLGPSEQSKLRTFVEKGASDSERTVIQTKSQILSQAYDVLGAKKDKAKQAGVAKLFNEEIAVLESQTGKEATASDIQGIYDRLVIKVHREQDYWFDDEFDLGNPESFKEHFEGYSVSVVSKVAKALEENDRKVTVKAIKSLISSYEQKRAQ